MKKVLKNLWYDYLMHDCERMETTEEKRIAEELMITNEALCATLSREQEELLKKSERLLDDMHAIYTEKAFEKGIEFSFDYLSALLIEK